MRVVKVVVTHISSPSPSPLPPTVTPKHHVATATRDPPRPSARTSSTVAFAAGANSFSGATPVAAATRVDDDPLRFRSRSRASFQIVRAAGRCLRIFCQPRHPISPFG